MTFNWPILEVVGALMTAAAPWLWAMLGVVGLLIVYKAFTIPHR